MRLKILYIILFTISQLTFGQHLFDFSSNNSITNPSETIKKLKSKILEKNVADSYFTIGLCYEYLNQEDSAFVYYLKAKKEFEKSNKYHLSKEISLNIHQVITSQKIYEYYGTFFLDEFNNYSIQKNDPLLRSLALVEFGILKYDAFNKKTTSLKVLREANELLKEALKNARESKNEILIANVYSNLATLKRYQEEIDSSRIYINKSLYLNKKNNRKNELFINYFNYGNSYFGENNFLEALKFYKIAEKINLPKYKNKTLIILYKKITKTCDSLNDNKNRRFYQEKQDSLSLLINEEKQDEIIANYQIKYETAEKELENLKLKSNIKFNKIISFSSIGLLLVIIIISILAYKNLSKKKKIIEQEKLLETQKLETTLKEQELHEIDVMLESQEKERQRIANELHDNLGSMLATLKLNFENLKRNDSNPTDSDNKLFEKTDDLIEEAYQKVRNISHLKNLGVIGSEGLVVAVKKMAEKMSVIEKLQINVIPHGLNERLENTLEVMLFRMIQELCTNIIKHSEATEVNIYLTQHNDNELNIIIEDNGKGFNPKDVIAKDGIGLKSIEKKVEQMNGTFTIDSIISKGTTIIIDLPI